MCILPGTLVPSSLSASLWISDQLYLFSVINITARKSHISCVHGVWSDVAMRLNCRMFTRLGGIPEPPEGYVPPLGASRNTWTNIYKNKGRIDYCVAQFGVSQLSQPTDTGACGHRQEQCTGTPSPLNLKERGAYGVKKQMSCTCGVFW